MALRCRSDGLCRERESKSPVLDFSEPNRAERSRPDGEKSAPLLPSPGQNPCSQKRAKDRGKRQPAHGQSVSDKQTNGTPSFLHSSLSPQASAEYGDLGIPGKHHSRLAAMPSPSVAPKLHPAALSPADVTLFPTTTSPGAAEGCEMENPTSSGPLAEGHPDNSFRGLPARPAALY